MKAGLLFVTICFAALSAFGDSFACPVATLATYEASGFHCREGKLSFSGFSFSSDSIDNAPQLTASLVVVTPLGDGFQFTAPDSSTGYSFFRAGDIFCGPPETCHEGSQNTSIAYDVTGPTSDATLWWGPFVFEGSDDVAGDNFWSVSETLCNFQQGCFGGLSLGAADTSGNLPPQTENFSTVARVHVTDGISLSGIGATQLPDGIFNEFSTPPVPEPSGLLLLGSGLIGLTGVLSKMRRS